MPRASGCVSSRMLLPLYDVATGMPHASAKARMLSAAPPMRAPFPATITGRFASANSDAARSTSAGIACVRPMFR